MIRGFFESRRKPVLFFRPLVSKISIFSILVVFSIFPVINAVKIMPVFVAVISSKPGMEMDYKNPLTHSARDERYSEVVRNHKSFLNHYSTHEIIFLRIALFNFNNFLLQGKTFHMKETDLV